MPIESTLLKDNPVTLSKCPKCGVDPFTPFMRGMVQRRGISLIVERFRAHWKNEHPRYCAVICEECKEIVGYEAPKFPA